MIFWRLNWAQMHCKELERMTETLLGITVAIIHIEKIQRSQTYFILD